MVKISVEPVKRVASMWVGSNLGPWEAVCLSSFVNRGIEVDLYVYSDVSGVPSGVTIKDGTDVVPEKLVEENPHQPGTYANFADLFRYRLLTLDNVVWVDTDVFMLGSLYKKDSYVFGYEGLGRVNGAVLGYPSASPLASFLLKECFSRRVSPHEWGALGPHLVTEGVKRFNLWSTVQRETTFYPIPWRQAWRLFNAEERQTIQRLTKNSATIHLWNEVLRNSEIGVKEHFPPEGSFAELLLKKTQKQSLFSKPAANRSDPKWNRWRLGLDPRDESSTLVFALKRTLGSAPQQWLGPVNKFFNLLRHVFWPRRSVESRRNGDIN